MQSILSTYHRPRTAGHRRRVAATVRCGGSLDRGNRHLFLDDVAGMAGRGAVVIDLRAVRFFDSAGLRALVAAIHRVHDRGGRIWLRCQPGPVASRLTEAGVQHLAPIDLACRRLARPAGERLRQAAPATPSA